MQKGRALSTTQTHWQGVLLHRLGSHLCRSYLRCQADQSLKPARQKFITD